MAFDKDCLQAWQLFNNGQVQQAQQLFQRSQQSHPDSALVHFGLGLVAKQTANFTQAQTYFQQAFTLLDTNEFEVAADYLQLLLKLGLELSGMGDDRQAMQCFDALLQAEPDNVKAHCARAFCLLANGDYLAGFAEYEWRFGLDEIHALRYPRATFWQGEPLTGQTILLHAEQGYGDSIHFIRYVPLVTELGGRIIIECQRDLQNLFKTLPYVAEVVTREDKYQAFDYHAPILSLPHILKSTLDTIPKQVPYLTAPYKKTLPDARANTCKVGICWAGDPKHSNDVNRSCHIQDFEVLFDVPNTQFYSLQKGPQVWDQMHLQNPSKVIALSEEMHDFADAAAFVNELDLVISVDTAPAHLAGALGRPVWLLLPYRCEWRWPKQGDTTAWYPSMTLFRQPAFRDWESVLARVRAALKSGTII